MLELHPATRALRRSLFKLLAAGALVGAGWPALISQALAAGGSPQREQGIFRLEGEVTFNGRTRKVGEALSLPLTVVTGPNSLLVFVLGADAYLLRANSHLILTGSGGQASSRVADITLLAGKLLSVFAPGERRLTTTTAVAGIRGTGLYLESEAERSYLCLCYGAADIGPLAAPHVLERLHTTHHESPRWIYRDHMEAAALINHSDAELILLESLVGRVPPFSPQWGEGILNDLSRKRY